MTTRNSRLLGVLFLFLGAAVTACGDDDENAGPPGNTDPNLFLFEDCEDGNNRNLLDGLWVSYDDYHDPGKGESVVTPTSWFKGGQFTMDKPGVGGAGYAAHITGTTATKLGYDYVGMATALGPVSFCPDALPNGIGLGQYAGLRFMAKGKAVGGSVFVKIIHTKDGPTDNCTLNGLTGDTLTNWDDYRADFTTRLTEDWSEITVNFRKDMAGPTSVDIETVLAHAKDIHFIFQSTAGGTIDLWVDNLTLYRDPTPAPVGTGEPDASVPDMVIQAPAPPAEVVLDSLEIANPLQQLAMTSLDRGYNITNWLEQKEFDDFSVYSEAFVQRLAAAGFRALRLPIDLDRYIANRTAVLAGEATFGIDPKLFTILDAFDAWTLGAGLSLTVDFHQYDKSFKMDDPIYADAVVGLWSGIAEHFATNTRNDLFYELLNEPEQSAGTSSVDPEAYWQFTERVIAGIRAHDANRPIIFGDVQWYGIANLTKRTPFADPNVIYAFHIYEPFIFTHQGASWSDVARNHDIPYPYSAERWSAYFEDLGFDPEKQPSWVISQARNYYRTGNRAALKNQVSEAKRWAVQNNVPVICNEFGAYDAISQKADRVAYYRDLTSVFRELEIPWQHWFMLMDASTGLVDPELAEAFGLE